MCYKASIEKREDVCPLTSLQLVKSDKQIDPNLYQSIKFDDERSIVYSKDTDNLPLTSVKLEYEPCMN